MILTYHEVVREDARYLYSVTCPEFDRQLALVREVSTEVAERFDPPVVTFDDGHGSNYVLALPLLQKTGLSAIFFVTTDWIGKRKGFMDWSQLREMQSLGHSIAAHGASHKLLTHCSASELEDEVRRSKQDIEDALGVAVTSISMPGGRWNSRVLGACRDAGYQLVYHSNAGVRKRSISGLEIRGRLMIHRGTTALALRPYLFENRYALFALRSKNAVKSIGRKVLGDALYSQAWRSLAAKDQSIYE